MSNVERRACKFRTLQASRVGLSMNSTVSPSESTARAQKARETVMNYTGNGDVYKEGQKVARVRYDLTQTTCSVQLLVRAWLGCYAA